ncbi:hypothetical protein [Moraxella atlantae]|uniref:Uncharacterized protein n=1 Tax=Faucicola atlantae TaxID=34059 RepID=A0A378Q6S4_9GAMM|nr:hypothetical protein [Moraxella atlantae]OPH34858.1 hypothetical protein B5J92_06400 [Moraxella atlantae]STY96226.1 Uncharacterised protein [Moraxella atlantae]
MSKPPKVKIKVLKLDELKSVAARLRKIARFQLTGTILCSLAAMYYTEQGSQLLPKVFGAVAFLTLVLGALSFRTRYKVLRLIALIKQSQRKP